MYQLSLFTGKIRVTLASDRLQVEQQICLEMNIRKYLRWIACSSLFGKSVNSLLQMSTTVHPCQMNREGPQ